MSARNINMLEKCKVGDMFHPIGGIPIVMGIQFSCAARALICRVVNRVITINVPRMSLPRMSFQPIVTKLECASVILDARRMTKSI